MSMRASLGSPIPEETVRIAHAAFPKGNVFMQMRDALGSLYSCSELITSGALLDYIDIFS
jgi:transposase